MTAHKSSGKGGLMKEFANDFFTLIGRLASTFIFNFTEGFAQGCGRELGFRAAKDAHFNLTKPKESKGVIGFKP